MTASERDRLTQKQAHSTCTTPTATLAIHILHMAKDLLMQNPMLTPKPTHSLPTILTATLATLIYHMERGNLLKVCLQMLVYHRVVTIAKNSF